MRSIIGPVFAAASIALLLAACTPQQALLASLIPPGTLNMVLGSFERVSDDNRRRVAELDARGDWAGLSKFADANLEKDRRNSEWWLVAGYARSRLGRHASASEAYAEAVSLEPDNPAAWHLLAQSYREGGEPRRAVTVLNNALLALRHPPLTYYLLGESYGDLGRDAEAAAAYREALKIERNFPAAWFGLGKSSRKLGRAADAREAELALEKLDPKLAQRLREGS